jgi:hypothetical protein
MVMMRKYCKIKVFEISMNFKMEQVVYYLPELCRVTFVVGHWRCWYFPMSQKRNGIDE